MSISILGGAAKGFSLAAPNSKDVRPTSVLLKRKFFDSHQNMEGVRFFDVCAGSGSIGFEALSRGAEFVEFVELSSNSLKTIKRNAKEIESKFSLSGEIRITKSDALKWVGSFSPGDGSNILFFDPPYENLSVYKSFLSALRDLLEKQGKSCKLVLEFCRQKTAPEAQVQEWLGKPERFYRQGTSFLYIYDFN